MFLCYTVLQLTVKNKNQSASSVRIFYPIIFFKCLKGEYFCLKSFVYFCGPDAIELKIGLRPFYSKTIWQPWTNEVHAGNCNDLNGTLKLILNTTNFPCASIDLKTNLLKLNLNTALSYFCSYFLQHILSFYSFCCSHCCISIDYVLIAWCNVMEIILPMILCTLSKTEKSYQWLMGTVSVLVPHIYFNEISTVYPFKVKCSLWNPWHFDEKCNKRKQYLVFMVSPWKFAGLTLRIPKTTVLSTKQKIKAAAPLEWNQSLMFVHWSMSVTCRSKHSEACCQVQKVDLSFRLVVSWPARLNGDLFLCVRCMPGKILQGTAWVHGINKKTTIVLLIWQKQINSMVK